MLIFLRNIKVLNLGIKKKPGLHMIWTILLLTQAYRSERMYSSKFIVQLLEKHSLPTTVTNWLPSKRSNEFIFWKYYLTCISTDLWIGCPITPPIKIISSTFAYLINIYGRIVLNWGFKKMLLCIEDKKSD